MQRSRGGARVWSGAVRTTRCVILAVLVLGAVEARAQARIDAETARLRTALHSGHSYVAEAVGDYDVVALRVEFQPDTTRYTTGNGTFDGPLFGDGLEPTLDPLPHDAAYFEAHLAFLRHYVATVSRGRANVRTHLLPGVVRVSQPMGAYSPTGPDSGTDAELARLAALIPEAWGQASLPTDLQGLDPRRTAFVLFHAGVGRDIELVGTTLDKTPEDLPSLYFDAGAIGRLTGAPLPSVGGLQVRNTLLIPRTETRRGFDFISDQPFLAEFSINGMLAASFLNFLGVPDLFDTVTGNSAIGPFGLMDGLGIFAMSGLFPPFPSAWTRVALGWDDPVEVDPAAGSTVTLHRAGDTSGPSVARVPVSDAEYFLVEVRHRDPDGTGVRMTVWKDGSEQTLTVPNGDPGFNPVLVDDFPGGVVTSAEPYDFALPGGLDENDRPLVGGVLIWHIDERVLAAGLAGNRVNADPEQRAVDLEEADGAQDLGYPTGGFFGPSFHLGSPFDFWYGGNPVSVLTSLGDEIRLYENRFGPDTVPDSRNSAGGPSFVEIGDFSEVAPTMTFTVRSTAEAGMTPPQTLWERPPFVSPSFFVDIPVVRLLPDGFAFLAGATPDYGIAQIRTVTNGGARMAEPAVDGEGTTYVLEREFVMRHRYGDSRPVGRLPVEQMERVTTPIVLTRQEPPEFYVGIVGDAGPRLLHFDDGRSTTAPEAEIVSSLAYTDDGRLIVVGLSRARVVGGDLEWNYPGLDPERRYRPMFGRDRRGFFGVLADPRDNRAYLLQPDGSVVPVSLDAVCPTPGTGCTVTALPTVGDLDGDGVLEAVVATQTHLWAFHRSGAVADGFPVPLKAEMGPGAPLVTRFTDVGPRVLVVGLSDGTVDAYDPGSGGRRVPGFPLAVGRGGVATPHVTADRIGAIDGAGTVRAWSLDRPAEPAAHLGSPANPSFFVAYAGPCPCEPSEALLDPRETYNWPNPVQDGSPTRIRFELTEPAEVSIRIHSLAGHQVGAIDVPSPATGVPVEVTWDADVPSGVYYARVRATTPAGRSEDRLVKIAVIR